MELDKGEYSTDFMGYMLEKGYSVNIEWKGRLGTAIDRINGYEPFFYIHNNNRYLYMGVYENPLTLESQDIKSILVFDRPMYMSDIITICPLYQSSYKYRDTVNEILLKGGLMDYIDFMNKRLILVDIQIKEPGELKTRNELFNINKRITTVDGYSRPYAFYSPSYPDGPIPGDVDYRRTLYWNPNVVTDSEGNAQVEFYNNSVTSHFNISAAGITASGIPYILNENW